MIRVIGNEMKKILSQKTIYVFSTAVIFVIFLNILGALITNNTALGKNYGETFPVTIFEGLAGVVIPIFIVAMVSNMVAEEYSEGTIKLTLLSRVSRSRLLTGKLLALGIILSIFLILMLLLGYGIGVALLGWGGEFMVKGRALTPGQGIVITLLTYGLSLIPFMSFAAFIMFISILTKKGGAATIVGCGVLFFLLLLQIAFPDLAQFIVTNYFNTYRIITSQGGIQTIVTGFSIIFTYGLILYALSLRIFNRQDILG